MSLSTLNRRRFLLVGTAGSFMFAGCLDNNWEVSLTGFQIVNHQETGQEFEIKVRDRGATIIDQTVQIGAGDIVDLMDEVEGPGKYVIEAAVGDWSADLDTMEVASSDQRCVGVEISLLDHQLEIQGWTTENC